MQQGYLWGNDPVLQGMENSGNVPWADYMRQLGFNNLSNITDFNSPLYQQYAQFLQKTTPGIGMNSLLAPLLAGGASYGGSQAIANQRMQQMSRERQDKINTGVQGFAGSLQSQVMPQIGQLMGSFDNTYQRSQQDAAAAQAASPWSQLGGVIGQGLGLWATGGLGGLFGGGGASAAVGGYRG